MAQILIRNIEDDLMERLRQSAARHGCSVEAELRDILHKALKKERFGGLGTEIAARFKGIGLRKGEEIPELRGFTIKNPFEE
ncbi:MAG: plasmid stabilization protein [Hyphomicrobiales bacterium]